MVTKESEVGTPDTRMESVMPAVVVPRKVLSIVELNVFGDTPIAAPVEESDVDAPSQSDEAVAEAVAVGAGNTLSIIGPKVLLQSEVVFVATTL